MRLCHGVLAVILAAAPPAFAQSTFKSGVDLVRMDVRVSDASGRPIVDLRPEDVEIIDGGQSLPIVLFQRVTEPADSYVEAAARAVSAEVSSNDAFPRGHLYILIFDQQHITPGNEQRARLAAEQFIRMHVRPADRVALFALPGPGPQLGFTSDKARAIKELASIRGTYERVVSSALGTMTVFEAHRLVQGDDRLLANVMERMAAEAGADVGGGSGAATSRAAAGAGEDPAVTRRLIQENARTIVNQSDSESRQFLQRLSDVIAGFRDIEGRKTVVLFSEGFFQDNLSRDLESVAAAAAQSYSVFYTFDLNRRTTGASEGSMSETTLATEIQSRIAPMATLAVETDGMMIVDAAGRTTAALDAIAAQTQEYYLVGFTPSDAARLERGKYRRVRIRVKRAGARVSARTGYAVAPDAATVDRKRAMDRLLGAPFVQQGLKVDYTTYVVKSSRPGQQRVVLSLTTDLPLRAAQDDRADVVFVVRDVRDGHVVASGNDTIPLPAAASAGTPMGQGAWRVQFDAPAGSFLMRAVVREPGGLAGSADRRFDVRALDGPDIAVSDLILGTAASVLPVRARAYSEDGLSGAIEVYGRTPLQLEGVEVRFELRRQDAPVSSSVVGELLDVQADEGGVSRRARVTLPLTQVPSGEYVARAVVRMRGETVAERTRQLDVLEGHAPAAQASEATARPETVSPLDIVRGDLAQRYIGLLERGASRTTVTPAAEAARLGQWERVEVELQRAQHDPKGVAQALRGLALFVREDYAGAAAALAASFAADSQNALTAFFLGWAHEGAGDTRAAIGAWRNAAHLDATLVSAHLALADAYLKAGQSGLAAQALRAGLAALPSSPELLAKLAQIERK
jgi:VWFA-related protein